MENKKKSIMANILLVIVILSGLFTITMYTVNLLNSRSRDAQRVTDISNVKSAIDQIYKMNKKYPKGGYEKLNLGIFFRDMPKDPLNREYFKYNYVVQGNSFLLYCKLEKPNYSGQNDGGKYANYYEVGSGKNWKSLIPKNLK